MSRIECTDQNGDLYYLNKTTGETSREFIETETQRVTNQETQERHEVRQKKSVRLFLKFSTSLKSDKSRIHHLVHKLDLQKIKNEHLKKELKKNLAQNKDRISVWNAHLEQKSILERDYHELDQNYSSLQRRLQQQEATSKNQILSLSSEITSLSETVHQLKSDLCYYQEPQEQQSEPYNSFPTLGSGSDSMIDDLPLQLQKQNDTFQTQLFSLQMEKDYLQTHLEENELKCLSLQSKVQELEIQLSVLRTTNDESLLLISTLQGQCQNHQQETPNREPTHAHPKLYRQVTDPLDQLDLCDTLDPNEKPLSSPSPPQSPSHLQDSLPAYTRGVRLNLLEHEQYLSQHFPQLRTIYSDPQALQDQLEELQEIRRELREIQNTKLECSRIQSGVGSVDDSQIELHALLSSSLSSRSEAIEKIGEQRQRLRKIERHFNQSDQTIKSLQARILELEGMLHSFQELQQRAETLENNLADHPYTIEDMESMKDAVAELERELEDAENQRGLDNQRLVQAEFESKQYKYQLDSTSKSYTARIFELEQQLERQTIDLENTSNELVCSKEKLLVGLSSATKSADAVRCLEAQVRNLELRYKDLDSSHMHLQNEVARLKITLKDCLEKELVSTSALSALEAKLFESETNYRSSTDEIHRLKVVVEEEILRSQQLTTERNFLQESITKLTFELESIKLLNSSQNLSNSWLTDATVSARLSHAETSLETKNSQIAELRGALIDKQKAIDNYLEELTSLQIKSRNSEDLLQDLEIRNKNTKSELLEEIDRLKQTEANLRTQLNLANSSSFSALLNYQRSHRRVEELENIVQEFTSAQDSLKNQLQSKDSELSSLQDQFIAGLSNCIVATEQVSTLKLQVQDLQTQLNGTRQSAVEEDSLLKSRLRDFEAKQIDHDRRTSALLLESERLREQLVSTTNKIVVSEKKYMSLKDSLAEQQKLSQNEKEVDRKNIRQLQEQLTQYAQTLEENYLKIDFLDSKLSEQHSSWQGEKLDLEQKLSNQRQLYQQSQLELETSIKKQSEIEASLQDSIAEARSLQSQIFALRLEITEKDENNIQLEDNLNSKIITLNKTIGENEEKLAKALEKSDFLKLKLKDFEDTLENFRNLETKRIQEAKAETARLREQFNKALAENISKRQSIEDQLETLEVEYRALKEQHSETSLKLSSASDRLKQFDSPRNLALSLNLKECNFNSKVEKKISLDPFFSSPQHFDSQNFDMISPISSSISPISDFQPLSPTLAMECQNVQDNSSSIHLNPRFFAEYNSLEPLDLVVSIEHCSDCDNHKSRIRHDPREYINNANMYLRWITQKLHEAKVVARVGVIRFSSNSVSGGRKIAAKKESRVGAFEIQLAFRNKDGHIITDLIHSRLASSRWPSIPYLEQRIQSFLGNSTVARFSQNFPSDATIMTENTISAYDVRVGGVVPWTQIPLSDYSWRYQLNLNVDPTIGSSSASSGMKHSQSDENITNNLDLNLRNTSSSSLMSSTISFGSRRPHTALPNVRVVGDGKANSNIDCIGYKFQFTNVEWVFDTREEQSSTRFSVGSRVFVSSLLHPRGGLERGRLPAVVTDIISNNSSEELVQVQMNYSDEILSLRNLNVFSNSGESFDSKTKSIPNSLDLFLYLLKQLKGDLSSVWWVQSSQDKFIPSPKLQADQESFSVDQRVLLERNHTWVCGNITILHSDHSCNISCEDGGLETHVPLSTVHTIGGLLLSRGSFFNQTRNLVWEVERANIEGLKTTTLRHPTSGNIVDLQTCYSESMMDWGSNTCGQATHIDIYQLVKHCTLLNP